MFKINLTGKCALVTGAGSGLAKETALLLASCGANVMVGDIAEEKAQETACELRQYGVKADACKVDISSRPQMKLLFQRALELTGTLDIVVNAAGIPYPKSFENAELQEVERLINVNILGIEHGCRLSYEIMQKQGYGRVVNFSSAAGRSGNADMPYYAMTKAAVINLTQSYALMAAPAGICYNAVCPGIIRTPMWEQTLDLWVSDRNNQDERNQQFNGAVGACIPMGVPQEAADIANAVVFLCSQQARYITGQTLNVDGGMNMN